MRKYQKGFTVVELVICIAGVVVLSLGGGFLYVLFHFVSKLW